LSGIPTATVTIYPIVSWFCESGILGGWPMAFYLPGTTGKLNKFFKTDPEGTSDQVYSRVTCSILKNIP